jgi:hypothetical protein
MDLPREPGLSRRLAYGEIVRRRLERRWNTFRAMRPMTPILTYEEMVDLPRVRVGLTLKQLRKNSVVYINEMKFCAVCQESNGDELHCVRELPCGHVYHIRCIDRWLEENTWCPVCKQSLRE